MSFKTKQDYYEIADGTNVVILSSNEGKSASNVEATGQDGSIVAHETFAETSAPSCEYAIKGDAEFSEDEETSIVFGKVTTVSSKKFALLGFSIATGGGSVPTFSANGEQVNDDAETGCTYTVPDFTLEKKHHAQILWNAFTLTGTGCHLVTANYTGSCTITKATKEGACLTFDVSGAKIEAQITVKQCGSTAPTIAAGTDWSVTAPLTETNPDGDYATFSATLTRYLAKDEEEEE